MNTPEFWAGFLCGAITWFVTYLMFAVWARQKANHKRAQIRRLVDAENIFEERRK